MCAAASQPAMAFAAGAVEGTVAYDTRVHLVITAIGACIFLALYGEKVQGSVGADVVDGAKARLLQVRRRISGTPASKAKRGSALGFKMFFPGEH